MSPYRRRLHTSALRVLQPAPINRSRTEIRNTHVRLAAATRTPRTRPQLPLKSRGFSHASPTEKSCRKRSALSSLVPEKGVCLLGIEGLE